MKTLSRFTLSALLLSTAGSARATLATWQSAVTGPGTVPATTLFSTVNGAAPIIFHVGDLTGDRAFEFIVNSGVGGASQALIGTQNPATGQQGLKFEQWNDTGVYGMTDFGVADHYSTTPYDLDRDVHIVFTSDGASTDMYIDGTLRHNFAGVALRMTGNQGLAAATNASETAFFDLMGGDVKGFASYDAALSGAEVLAHYNAFVIPEPSAAVFALMGSLALARRRR